MPEIAKFCYKLRSHGPNPKNMLTHILAHIPKSYQTFSIRLPQAVYTELLDDKLENITFNTGFKPLPAKLDETLSDFEANQPLKATWVTTKPHNIYKWKNPDEVRAPTDGYYLIQWQDEGLVVFSAAAFSNMTLHPFKHKELYFPSREHALQLGKASEMYYRFKDSDKDPSEISKLKDVLPLVYSSETPRLAQRMTNQKDLLFDKEYMDEIMPAIITRTALQCAAENKEFFDSIKDISNFFKAREVKQVRFVEVMDKVWGIEGNFIDVTLDILATAKDTTHTLLEAIEAVKEKTGSLNQYGDILSSLYVAVEQCDDQDALRKEVFLLPDFVKIIPETDPVGEVQPMTRTLSTA